MHGGKGKQHLLKQLAGYNRAAQFQPWAVIGDLDIGSECPPGLRQRFLPAPAPKICFRIVVREIEAWLLADRERAGAFLGISRTLIPIEPEAAPDPKELMVSLARRSGKRQIREDMAPRPQSGRQVGPGYTTALIEFVTDSAGWRPGVAAENSVSLRRCLDRLRHVVEHRE